MTIDTIEHIEANAQIETWFGVGGRADRFLRPRTVEDVVEAVRSGERVRVLGDGANLLVADDGVDGLVISLDALSNVTWPDAAQPGQTVEVIAEAGMNLPRLLLEAVRRGLQGLEGLGGIPASVGGATIMNAGGAFGTFGDQVAWIEGIGPAGNTIRIDRNDIPFSYRTSGLNSLVITRVAIALTVVEPKRRLALRERLKEVMAYKKSTQPLAARSAGCIFRNPEVNGERVSAGAIIDEVGCKGLRRGSARVSDHHANFIVTEPGCTATDIMRLIDEVRATVQRERGIELHEEVVIWRRRDHA